MQEAAVFAKRKEMLRDADAESKGCTFKPKLRRKPPRPEMASPKSLGAQYAAYIAIGPRTDALHAYAATRREKVNSE